MSKKKKNNDRYFKQRSISYCFPLLKISILIAASLAAILLFSIPKIENKMLISALTILLLCFISFIITATINPFNRRVSINDTGLSSKITKDELFSDYINEIPVFFVVINADRKVRYMNKFMLDTLGYQKKEVLQRNFIEQSVPHRHRKLLEDKFFCLNRKDRPTYNENIILTKDGKELWTRWYVHPVYNKNGNLDYLNCIGLDITNQRNTEQELEKLFIPHCDRNILSVMKENAIHNLFYKRDFLARLNCALNLLSKALPNNGSFITILENNQLRITVVNGFKDNNEQQIIKNLEEANHDFIIEKEAIEKQKPIIVDDTYKDPRWVIIPGLEWIRSSIKIPIIFDGRILGTLGIVSKERNAFDEKSIKKIEIFIVGITSSIYDYLNYYQLIKNRDDIIHIITKLVEARDPYTAGHQEKVAQLAISIAREMGLGEDRIEAVRLASLVHDIGKINIPSEILNKPSNLNDIEYSLVKNHSRLGYDILKEITFTSPIAEIVYQHHEKFDGSGYPRGLKGEQIMLEARIICVADIFEAISSHRPYRPSLGIEAAEDELKRNRGILYDTEVVDACLKVCSKIMNTSLH